MPSNITTIVTYGFLYLAVLFLWVPTLKKVPLWGAALMVSIAFGLISKRLDFIGVIFTVLLAVSAYCLRKKEFSWLVRVLFGVALFILGVGLEAHLLPGFHNLKVLNNVKISPDGIPFSLYLNFDKTIVGLFILGILSQLISTKGEWLNMLKIMAPRAILVVFMVACLSLALQFVRFDPKIPSHLFIWAITNLLFVCVAEEAFFRGFVQKYLCLLLKKYNYGTLIAVIIASILFGLAHYSGGIKYVLLATAAGMGYGWVYFRSKRIEASIITHFSLNLTHILLFTYPALTKAF